MPGLQFSCPRKDKVVTNGEKGLREGKSLRGTATNQGWSSCLFPTPH